VDKSSTTGPIDHPFVLKIVNSNGTSCGKCRLNQTCIGCVLDEDDKPGQLKDRTMLAVEWDDAVSSLENIYDGKAHKSYVQHSSASEGKDENEHSTMNLYDCLKLFMTQEKLSPNDPWFCPKCKKHREATKKLDLWKLPEVLIVHLKRFQYNRYSRDKLNTLVDFPTDTLDLSEFVTNPADRHVIYELYAVSNHSGGLGGGHYTAYAKNKEDNRWYNFNDSFASEAQDTSRIVSSSAYVLFYRRKRPQANTTTPTTNTTTQQ